MRVAVVVLLLAVLGGCATGRGHPIRIGAPRIPDHLWPAPEPDLPEPEGLTGEAARTSLMAGLGGLYAHLLAVRERAGVGRNPTFVRLGAVERAVWRRYRNESAPGGDVRHVTVVGTAGRVPIPPAAMAALIADPDVERQVLAAQTFKRTRTAYVLPGQRRDAYWVEKLRVGVGPFRYDLRFATVVEQMDLGDGRIALRYDPRAAKGTTGVSLYRGVALIEPEGEGSRITEVIVFGTPLSAPAPFDKLLGNLIYDTLRHRSTNLWIRAWR